MPDQEPQNAGWGFGHNIVSAGVRPAILPESDPLSAMRSVLRLMPAALLMPILSGCVTSVVSTAVTAPFKVAGKAVDWTTTSQEEADRNLGRKTRKEQEKREKEEREQARRNRAES